MLLEDAVAKQARESNADVGSSSIAVTAARHMSTARGNRQQESVERQAQACVRGLFESVQCR